MNLQSLLSLAGMQGTIGVLRQPTQLYVLDNGRDAVVDTM